MWQVVENAYGEAHHVTGFATMADALFYAQSTRCTEERPRKVCAGCYELLGRDIICKEGMDD